MRRILIPLCLLLCLLCASCRTQSAPQEETPHNTPTEQAPTSPTATNPSVIQLSLMDGTYGEVCKTLPTVQTHIYSSIDEVRAAVADGTANFALLPLDTAVSLFYETRNLQVIALFTPVEIGEAQPLDCLVASPQTLTSKADVLQDFLNSYRQATTETQRCSTGWEMVDQIQTYCEAQFAQAPDSIAGIPDDSFYYFTP